jgi:glycosyltransferase involved in cell wall biosynthesis
MPARISVMVPTYNWAAYLDEALESILTQDFSDLDLLVADTASDHATESVVAAHSDPGVQHLRRDRNVDWL